MVPPIKLADHPTTVGDLSRARPTWLHMVVITVMVTMMVTHGRTTDVQANSMNHIGCLKGNWHGKCEDHMKEKYKSLTTIDNQVLWVPWHLTSCPSTLSQCCSMWRRYLSSPTVDSVFRQVYSRSKDTFWLVYQGRKWQELCSLEESELGSADGPLAGSHPELKITHFVTTHNKFVSHNFKIPKMNQSGRLVHLQEAILGF